MNVRRLIKMAYEKPSPAHRTRTSTVPGPYFDLIVVSIVVVLGVGMLFF